MRKRSELGKPVEAIGKPAEVTPNKPFFETKKHTEQVICSSCGLEQPGGTSDCLACGATLDFKLKEPTPATAMSNQDFERENIGKLAYDLDHRDIKITLNDLCMLQPDQRRALRDWLDAKSPDVTPAARMVLEKLKGAPPPPASKPDLGKIVEDMGKAVDGLFAQHLRETKKPETKSVAHVRGSVLEFVETTDRTPNADEGEEVTYIMGKEMYRVAEFCTFDIGPISASTRIRPGETRQQALHRLRVDIEEVADLERVRRRDGFIATMLGIKDKVKEVAKSRE